MLTKRGFTLLEVLIAIVILTIGAVSIIRAFSTGMFASTDIENVDLALDLAQERVEYIKGIGYGFTGDTKNLVPGFSVFQRQATATVLWPNLKRINVTVYWNMKGGETSITLTTYVANY